MPKISSTKAIADLVKLIRSRKVKVVVLAIASYFSGIIQIITIRVATTIKSPVVIIGLYISIIDPQF